MRSDSGDSSSLTPVLCAGMGRTGGTLLMSLLATSDEIVFDRIYPFEILHLLRVAQQCASYDELTPSAPATPRVGNLLLLRATDAARRLSGYPRSLPPRTRSGPVYVSPSPNLLSDAPGREPYWQRCLRENLALCLGTIAASVANSGTQPRYYAEKAVPWLVDDLRTVGTVRALYRLRDPRDVWLSIQAFDKKRGYYGFGRRSHESASRYLDRFLAGQREYLRRVARVIEGAEEPDSKVVRFEDLVWHTAAVAGEIGDWLGVTLDASAAQVSLASRVQAHSTSAVPDQAVGRWRREMANRQRDRFSAEIGDVLESVGYSAE